MLARNLNATSACCSSKLQSSQGLPAYVQCDGWMTCRTNNMVVLQQHAYWCRPNGNMTLPSTLGTSPRSLCASYESHMYDLPMSLKCSCAVLMILIMAMELDIMDQVHCCIVQGQSSLPCKT